MKSELEKCELAESSAITDRQLKTTNKSTVV